MDDICIYNFVHISSNSIPIIIEATAAEDRAETCEVQLKQIISDEVSKIDVADILKTLDDTAMNAIDAIVNWQSFYVFLC
jgi:hypothetical protein